MSQAVFLTKIGDMSEVRFHVFNIYSILQSLHNYTIMMLRLYTVTIDNQDMSCHIAVEMYNIPDLNLQIRVILHNT